MGTLSCSEGKGHTFESCRARQFSRFLQRDMCARTNTPALPPSSEPARLLNVDLPGHIPAGEVKIDPVRDIFPNDLGPGGGTEGALVDTKERLTISGLRPEPQQRSERQPMHHAEATVVVRLESQSVDILAPVRWISLLRCFGRMSVSASTQIPKTSDAVVFQRHGSGDPLLGHS
jgi:hypothetical protein